MFVSVPRAATRRPSGDRNPIATRGVLTVDPCSFCGGEFHNAPNNCGQAADGVQFGSGKLMHCKACERFIGRGQGGGRVEMVDVWSAGTVRDLGQD
jgi:hypothetical protein